MTVLWYLLFLDRNSEYLNSLTLFLFILSVVEVFFFFSAVELRNYFRDLYHYTQCWDIIRPQIVLPLGPDLCGSVCLLKIPVFWEVILWSRKVIGMCIITSRFLFVLFGFTHPLYASVNGTSTCMGSISLIMLISDNLDLYHPLYAHLYSFPEYSQLELASNPFE